LCPGENNVDELTTSRDRGDLFKVVQWHRAAREGGREGSARQRQRSNRIESDKAHKKGKLRVQG
jgi:hypothetical protein